MKQYNRIMLGEHGMYISDCLEKNYIGAGFLENFDLSGTPYDNEVVWRQKLVEKYLQVNPDKSVGTARNSIGFLWTVCFGLKKGDIVLASNGNSGYNVCEITGDYYYEPNTELPHRRAVEWKNVLIPRKLMSQQLQNSTGSIGTCCNITKYADELEALISGSTQAVIPTPKWVHPDMVGVEFNEFQDTATRSLLKAAETKEYIALFSYELKRTIENDHQLKEYFFQALSNSSWANYGYLVALEISEDVMEEMARLNRSFGIGLIKLSPYKDDTTILFHARKNELDYYTIDKLCRINKDFRDFINRTTKVINAQTEVLEDVKGGLLRFCDKGFSSDEEMQDYCKEHHIPC